MLQKDNDFMRDNLTEHVSGHLSEQRDHSTSIQVVFKTHNSGFVGFGEPMEDICGTCAVYKSLHENRIIMFIQFTIKH